MGSIESILVQLATMSPARYLALLLGVLGVYYFSFFDDGAKYDQQFNRLRQQTEEQAKIAEQTKQLLSEKEEILRNRDMLALKFKESLKALPPQIDVADLVRGINSTAKSAGVKINNIRPSNIQRKEFFDQLPIEIEAQGKFGELVLFLSYVARMPRIVRIVSYNIGLTQTNKSNHDVLVLKSSLMGYRSRPLQQKKDEESNTRSQR